MKEENSRRKSKIAVFQPVDSVGAFFDVIKL
jgi:hypothetical protein